MVEQIGRYEIRRELERGGMATVYLAYDPRFQRQVAIKVLPRQFTHDPKYLARFEQEARTIAALEHPAIVPVHDFGEHNDAPYLVMRYMAGGNLRQRLGSGPLALGEIASVLDRLAPALDHAHELGVIHRDLKPSNILFDDEERPYLADFGIARLAEASQTMTIIGTPAYMSPEQAESKEKLDGRSDIYALGVLLYELLTGAQPYVAETPTGQMVMHILEPIPDILAANPDLPPETQDVIDKAMAKDRQQRYQSAAELAAAVNALLALERTAASAPAAAPAEEESLAGPEIEEVALPAGEALVEAPEEEIAPPEEAAVRAVAEVIDDGPQPVLQTGAEAPAPEEAAAGRALPIWVWGLAALAVLIIAGLGIRFILQGGAAEEPVAEEVPEEPAEEPRAGEEITGEEGIRPDADLPPPEAAPGETWVRPADGMPMLFVPGGAFLMGSAEGETDEAPAHEVVLDAFWIDHTEVTFGQYERCVSVGRCEPSPFAENEAFNGGDFPVVGVSWHDAAAYCAWTGGQLPSEAQWEYAARGPESLVFPWGNEFDGHQANFCDANCPYDHANHEFNDGFVHTAPVGSYPNPSWTGQLDMAGNVWEWVDDWHDPDYYEVSPLRNPPGPESGENKVLRGGSWGSDAYSLRATHRRITPPDFKEDYAGFRCASGPGG